MLTIEKERGAAVRHRHPGLAARLESHRPELRRHCQRMLSSAFEADDAAQETLVRAWRHYERFEGRSSLRSWLYRIATNVCRDMLRGPQRRASPVDFGTARGGTGRHVRWADAVTPGEGAAPVVPAGRDASAGDPADLVASREAVRAAFAVALQRLPSRQRAVLILREVLGWHAAEVADLLGCTLASVNSALQRARATLAAGHRASPGEPDDDRQRALLAGYVRAFERSDVDTLVSLLHLDHRSPG